VVALLAACGLAAAAGAAPVPISQVNWDLMTNSVGFGAKLSGDCLDASREELHWTLFSAKSPFRYTQVFEGVGVSVSGSFDPATKAGSIAGTGPALRFDNYNAHARAIRVGAFGLRAIGGGATLTGRIERTRTIFARFGPPRPLMRLTRLTLQSGPFQRKGKDVADTFVMALQGRATVLPALARELNRIRCRGPHIVTSHPIRAGTPFGVVRAQLRPDAAGAIGGFAELRVGRLDSDDGPVAIAPTRSGRTAGKNLRFDLPADLRTPLTCAGGYSCFPAIGAHLPLVDGGFVLSLGARSTTVAGLTLDSVQNAAGEATPVLNGTLDGSPVVVIYGSGTTQDFDDRVKAALGTTDFIAQLSIAAQFTNTVPP
jgi:hypothetical protein